MSLQKAPPEEAQGQRAVFLAEALAILQPPVREVLGTPPWCLSGSWSLSGEGRATEGHYAITQRRRCCGFDPMVHPKEQQRVEGEIQEEVPEQNLLSLKLKR